MKNPRVTLVGAGPGDPELITLKAVHALAAADVVLYDALVSAEVLKLVPAGVPSFSVGKRAGGNAFPQEKINLLLVKFARRYGHVVRLKGGDPFVYGRGLEEVAFVHQHGIPAAVVPGISSALAVPAAAGISVTARNISESVWVLTGTTRWATLSNDIVLAAQSTATLVILMGLNKLAEIMDVLKAAGRHHLAVAVIQQGTLPTQRMVTGTVETIVDETRRSAMTAPAVIVIGETVRHATTWPKTAEAPALASA
jgi:uroporphyrin-III C-methyltransferase